MLENQKVILDRYIARRSYHYARLFVADKFDRTCLDLDTLIKRKRDLENDKEYLALAKAYWILRGVIYNLQDDGLWIKTDSWVDYKIRKEQDRYAVVNPQKTARFPLEDNLYEIWINLEENRQRYRKS